MADSDREAYQRKVIEEAISLAAFLVTLIAYQATVDPTFREMWKARIKRLLGLGPKRNYEQELLEQVQKEISLMEHEMGGDPDAN